MVSSRLKPSGKSDRFVFELIENPEWHDKASAFQFLIPLDNPAAFRDYLERGVSSGQLQKADIFIDGENHGMLVYFIDRAASAELVLLACYCDFPGADAATLINDGSEQLAKKHGCISIRLHTRRPGLIKKSMSLGFRLSEVTMRKHL